MTGGTLARVEIFVDIYRLGVGNAGNKVLLGWRLGPHSVMFWVGGGIYCDQPLWAYGYIHRTFSIGVLFALYIKGDKRDGMPPMTLDLVFVAIFLMEIHASQA